MLRFIKKSKRRLSLGLWLLLVIALPACVSVYDPGGEPLAELEGLSLEIVVDEETGVGQVVFPTLDFGESFRAVFELRNTGTGALEIGAITTDHSAFVVSEHERRIGSDEAITFSVTFKPEGFGDQRATLAFFSNDEDKPLFRVRLLGSSNAAPRIGNTPSLLTLPRGLNTEDLGDGDSFATLFYHEFDLNDPAQVITDEVELVIKGRFSNGTSGTIIKTKQGNEIERLTIANGKMSYYLVIRFGVSTRVDFDIFLRFPDGRVTETTSYPLVRPDGAN
ncbi:MAG: DUF1573 domain-containing protein [Bernardetiaceae bacterium]